MSRSSALAYDLPATLPPFEEEADGWPGRGDSGAYRLLGDSAAAFGGPRPLVPAARPGNANSPRTDSFDGLDQLLAGYARTYEGESAGVARWRGSLRVLAGLGGAVLVAIALLLVGPAWAMVPTSTGPTNLAISRYAEVSGTGIVTIADGPIINTAPDGQPAQQEQPPASAPVGSYDLVSAPSTSVKQIEAVLSKYGSPAAGQGQALYDLGVKYGIDPAYALAFFVHESACGTRGVARFTHSLGNIRWTAGYDNYEGYRSYATWQDGIEDWYKLITDLYINGWGLRTVDQIIPVYAPAADGNSPRDYAASVKWLVESWRGK